MSAGDRSAIPGEPDRYRMLAAEVRALIASGTLHAHETLEDLLQLADWYEALAEQVAHLDEANDPTGPMPLTSVPAETSKRT
jgi:hypothetical protein